MITRRGFLTAFPPLAADAALGAQTAPRRPGRLKITGIRVVRLKVIKELGSLEPSRNPGAWINFRLAGGSFTEIRTDQGLVDIGPGIDPAAMESSSAKLVGKDPFDTEQNMALMRYDAAGGLHRGPAQLDIALWVLIGKVCGQPIYKLGGSKEKVTAYASMVQVSNPAGGADMAAKLLA